MSQIFAKNTFLTKKYSKSKNCCQNTYIISKLRQSFYYALNKLRSVFEMVKLVVYRKDFSNTDLNFKLKNMLYFYIKKRFEINRRFVLYFY